MQAFLLSELVYTKVWWPSKVKPHLQIEVEVSVSKDCYTQCRLQAPRHTRDQRFVALQDSGAQMVVMGPQHVKMLGIQEEELLPVSMKIYMVDNRSQGSLGMAILEIPAKDGQGQTHTTWQQAHIMEGAKHLYLCNKSLQEL